MGRHELPRHRHTWTARWTPVPRDNSPFLTDPGVYRYDDGTVLHRKTCTFPGCLAERRRCMWPRREGAHRG